MIKKQPLVPERVRKIQGSFAGSSIFEIKEMLGHDRIQTTNRYLRIHTKMMREVLFDETF